jgi:PcfJ-like protein
MRHHSPLPFHRDPVRLLWDDGGIYGIGGEFSRYNGQSTRLTLILRRDLLGDVTRSYGSYPVLQMISGGLRYGLFWHSLEEAMRQEIHHEFLNRAGLPWPPPDHRVRWWSSDRRQQDRNRRTFHGLRLKSLAIINGLICQALAEAADPDALKLARRFSFVHRYDIYRAAALSVRARQLVEAFPALGLAIYSNRTPWSRRWVERPFDNTEAQNSRNAAMRLVEAGAPLRRVAEAMGVPMALRRVKSAAALWGLRASEICARNPTLFHAYLPDPLPPAKLWLRAVCAADDVSPEFGEWIAKHCLKFPGGPGLEGVLGALRDLTEWVQAGYRASVPPDVRRALMGRHHDGCPGDQFVTRPFSSDISLRTALRLSGEWHEAVANNLSGPNHEFPPAWCDAGQSGAYEIIPITTSGELYREGRAMHHCAGTYADNVRYGSSYFFSVRENSQRVATLKLVRVSDKEQTNPFGTTLTDEVRIGQLRGPCNGQVPKTVERAVRAWLRTQRPRAPHPNEIRERVGMSLLPVAGGRLEADLDDIPF